jgi:hypothetical protein
MAKPTTPKILVTKNKNGTITVKSLTDAANALKKKPYTASNRNIKLEKKLSKVGAPPGYQTGMGSKVKGGKETVIVMNMGSGNAAKIKGSLRNTKENIVKAIAKADKVKYETPSAYKARMKKEKLAASKPATKVPVKSTGRGMRGGISFGGGSGLRGSTNK